MKTTFIGMLCGMALICSTSIGWAHLSVSGSRTLNGGNPIDNAGPLAVDDRTVSSSFGWADGADSTFGDSHRLTAFKFTLGATQDVTLTVSGASGLLPGFSLYTAAYPTSPLAHDGTPFLANDFNDLFGNSAVAEPFDDTNANTVWNVGESFTDTNGNGVYDTAGLGNSGKEGAFRALNSWHMYNDSGVRTDFTYLGHAVDGTVANYGAFAGINGDGIADGIVIATFYGLAPGDYFILVGGADYLAQNVEEANPAFPTYGISVTVQAVPEPSAIPLLGAALFGLAFRRVRNSRPATHS